MKTKLLILVLALACLAIGQTTYTATIANGGSLSSAINIRAKCVPAAIIIPSAWTAANLTFQVSADGVTYGNLRDVYAAEVTAQVSAATDVIQLPAGDWYWVKWLKLRSGTAASAVNQAGDRTITVLCSARND